MSPVLIAVAHAAALAAQTPPAAPQAAPRFAEERCVYDALLRANPPPDSQAAFDALVQGCRDLYGWSQAKAQLAVEIARFSVEMVVANGHLRAAGIEYDRLEEAYQRISPSDRAVIGNPSDHPAAEVEAAGRRMAEVIVGSGLRADSGELSRFFAARAHLFARLDEFRAMQ